MREHGLRLKIVRMVRIKLTRNPVLRIFSRSPCGVFRKLTGGALCVGVCWTCVELCATYFYTAKWAGGG